jgi:hypothetical protein
MVLNQEDGHSKSTENWIVKGKKIPGVKRVRVLPVLAVIA